MDARKEEGFRIEGLVAEELTARGYAILARNWSKRCGELDIVAMKGREVVVCEVRSRRTGSFEDAWDSVNEVKRRKLRTTAHAFLAACPFGYDEVRFFVAAAVGGPGDTRITIIEDAF